MWLPERTRRSCWLILGSALIAAIGGCAEYRPLPETPALRKRVLPPAAASALEPTSAVDGRLLGQAPILPPGPISLRQAIRIALANNHTLRLAREDVGIAQQQVYVARSLFLPQVTAGYGYAIRDREVEVEFGGMAFPTAEKEFQHAELRVQMTIWDFGRSLGKYEQAHFGREIASLQRRRIEQGVIYRVTKAYFDILRAQKARTIAQEAVDQAQAHLKTAQSLFANGVVDKNDVLRAEVRIAETRQRLIIAENVVALAISAFNYALGINVNHTTEVIDITEVPKLSMVLTEALQKAIDHRPEFELVQKSIRLEEAGLTAARGEYLPRIYVAGTLSRLDDDYLVHKNSALGEIGIQMDLFTGGRRTAKYRTARHRRRKAVETAKQVCDGIALEVKQALLDIEATRKRLAVAEKAVSQAEENLRLINNKYRQTAATPTDVVDAQTQKTRAEWNYYTALYGHIVAVKRLEFAMGTIDDIPDDIAVQNAKPSEAKQPTSAAALPDEEK